MLNILCKADVTAVLHPKRINPLKPPRWNINVAGHIYPNVRSCLTKPVVKCNPLLPHIRNKIHILIAAYCVVVLWVLTRLKAETVKLPIIYIKFLCGFNKEIAELFDISCWGNTNIPCFLVEITVTCFLIALCDFVRSGISAAGTEPQAKARAKLIAKSSNLCELVWELFVKAPKACLYIRPAVINNIGCELRSIMSRKMLVHLCKGGHNILLCDVLHIVVPAVVLEP